MALHCLESPEAWHDCTSALRPDDALLVLDRAVPTLAQQLAHREPLPCPIFVLAEEWGYAALDPLPSAVSAIDYGDWVTLTLAHPQQLTWR